VKANRRGNFRTDAVMSVPKTTSYISLLRAFIMYPFEIVLKKLKYILKTIKMV
jgi:hypothetical protein